LERPANWTSNSVPNGVGNEADLFGRDRLEPDRIYGHGNYCGTINFNNANTYEITGTGSLTLQTAIGNAQVIVKRNAEINLRQQSPAIRYSMFLPVLT